MKNQKLLIEVDEKKRKPLNKNRKKILSNLNYGLNPLVNEKGVENLKKEVKSLGRTKCLLPNCSKKGIIGFSNCCSIACKKLFRINKINEGKIMCSNDFISCVNEIEIKNNDSNNSQCDLC